MLIIEKSFALVCNVLPNANRRLKSQVLKKMKMYKYTRNSLSKTCFLKVTKAPANGNKLILTQIWMI